LPFYTSAIAVCITTGGKRRQMTSDKRRHIAASSLPLFVAFCRSGFAPVFSTTISLGDGVVVQNRFPDASLHRLLSLGLNVCNCPAWMVRGRVRGRGLAVDGSQQG
jgi:hypothetical protein